MLEDSSSGVLVTAPTLPDATGPKQIMSDHHSIPEPKRRSTGASDALQYYWSESAGERSPSFTSSSIGKSVGAPSSPYSLSPYTPLQQHGSHLSLRELVEQEAEQERQRSRPRTPPPATYEDGTSYPHHGSPRKHDMPSSAGPSNRRIHLVSYSSDGLSSMISDPNLQQSIDNAVHRSTSTQSVESAYSHEDEPPMKPPSPIRDVSAVRISRGNLANRQAIVNDGSLGSLLDPTFEEWAHQRSWESKPEPSSPQTPARPEAWGTPRQGAMERPQTSPFASPSTPWSGRTTPHYDSDRTPRNSTFPAGTPTSHPSSRPSSSNNSHPSSRPSSSKTTHSGRLLFVAPADVSRRSLDDLQRDISELGLDARGDRGARVGLSVSSPSEGLSPFSENDTPRSAPASKTAFDDIDIKTRSRPASLVPSRMASPSSHSPTRSSPLNRHMGVPSRNGSPAITSPEPPPRSQLRGPTPTPLPPPKDCPESQDNVSVRNKTPPLPTIINTPHTPEPRGVPLASPGSAATKGSSRSTSPPVSPQHLSKSGTIKDLTNLLGGAIDEIGLVDSRDVPPPTVVEPVKAQKPLYLPVQTGSGNVSPETQDLVPSLSPTSAVLSTSPQGSIGLSISGARGNVSRHVRKASSILSLRSSLYGSPTSPAFSLISAPQTLPQAVLYGNIKTLRTSGERARAYARSISELGRTDSGLREMCANISRTSVQRTRQPAYPAGLGMGNANPQARNVSAGSEFPMRADAYTAREIAVRNLEPSDEPSALPPNLPFPALQLQNVAIKASGSMQSITNAAMNRRPHFLAALRLKKDKENTTLPPPTGSLQALKQEASASKKDLVSAPTNLVTRRNSLGAEAMRVNPALPMPRGPRGPSEGMAAARASIDVPPRPISQTPPRPSLDSTLSLSSNRSGGVGGPRPLHSSTLSNTPAYTSTPSPLAKTPGGHGEVSEGDINEFSTLVPQAERSVIRAYLQRYGEMHYAVTAFIEDEKLGGLMKERA